MAGPLTTIYYQLEPLAKKHIQSGQSAGRGKERWTWRVIFHFPTILIVTKPQFIFDAMFQSGLQFLIHLDDNLAAAIQSFGPWTYLFMCLIIVLETGMIITSFLPGDSLLFVAGTAASGGFLELRWLIPTFVAAGFLGDMLNYHIGSHVGIGFFRRRFPGLVRRGAIARTSRYFEKYGGKTILFARFVPLVRTFAPFLAGMGRMHYRRFMFYNLVGAIIWSTFMVLAGYFLGTFLQPYIPVIVTLMLAFTFGTILVILIMIIKALSMEPEPGWDEEPGQGK